MKRIGPWVVLLGCLAAGHSLRGDEVAGREDGNRVFTTRTLGARDRILWTSSLLASLLPSLAWRRRRIREGSPPAGPSPDPTGTGPDRLLDHAGQLHLALAASGIGVWQYDFSDGRARWFWDHPEFHSGHPAECQFREILRRLDRSHRRQLVARTRLSLGLHQRFEMEAGWTTASGRRLTLAITGEGQFDPVGQPVRLVGTVRDITEPRRAERLDAGQRNVLRMIAHGGPLASTLTYLLHLIEAEYPEIFSSILLLDEDGRRLRTGAAPRLPAEYNQLIDGIEIGINVGSCGTAAYLRQMVVAEDIATDRRWQNYKKAALPHGLRACWSTPILQRDGRVLGTFAVYYRTPGPPREEHRRMVADATATAAIAIERHRAEQAQVQNEALVRSVIDALPSHLAVIDQEGNILQVNESWLRFAEQNGSRDPLAYLGQNYLEVCARSGSSDPVGLQQVREGIESVLGGRIPMFVHEYPCDAPWEKRWFSMRVTPLSGPQRGAVVVHDNVSVRRAADLAIRDSHSMATRLATVAASFPGALYAFERRTDGKLLIPYSSPKLEEVVGVCPSAVHEDATPFFNLIHPAEVAAVRRSLLQSMNAGRTWEAKFRVLHPRRGLTWVETRADPQPVLDAGADRTGSVVWNGILLDISERVRMEEQLRQAQKMEAIGLLSGGIAHDFNNILTSIIANAQLAAGDVSSSHPVYDCLQEILGSSRRAAALVRQILTFARSQPVERHPLDLTRVAREALAILRASIPTQVEVEPRLEAEGAWISGEETQLHQVLLNLGTNAWQAFDQRPGRIRVTVERVRWESVPPSAQPGLTPGPCVRLAVEDTGMGMSPEVLERIFDPFFTTKAPGEGTGLGLSMVHGIVKAHGGTISVVSEPGRGSIFSVFFPEITRPSTPLPLAALHPVRGAGERLLLLDDEAAIVRVTARTLQRLGYRVQAFVDADEARAVFDRDPSQFDLVITDLNMPKMSGFDFARHVRSRRGDLPILLSSGRMPEDLTERSAALALGGIIHKPISLEELSAAVRQALHPGRGGAAMPGT